MIIAHITPPNLIRCAREIRSLNREMFIKINIQLWEGCGCYAYHYQQTATEMSEQKRLLF